jgi:hypothetical protein
MDAREFVRRPATFFITDFAVAPDFVQDAKQNNRTSYVYPTCARYQVQIYS